MSDKESQGGCNTHGPFEVCGHTTGTCPDIAKSEANEIGQEAENNPELKRLKTALESLESSVEKHPLVAQSSIDTFEKVSLKRAKDKGVDIDKITGLEARLEALKQKAPVAELEDIIRRMEEFYTSGDIVGAKLWYTQAASRLSSRHSTLSEENITKFMERLKKMPELWE